MFKSIVIGGLITALILFALSWLIGFLNIGFLNMHFGGGIIPMLITALILGVVNALLIPLVMSLFKKARGVLLFIITVAVDAAALLLVAHFTAVFSIDVVTAIIVAIILGLIGPFSMKASDRK